MKKWIGIITAAAVAAVMAMPVSAAEEVYKVNCSSFSTDGSDVWASLDTDGVLTISGTGKMDSYFLEEEDVDDGYPWRNSENAKLIDTVIVEEGVTGVDIVYVLPNLKNLYLPNSLEAVNPFNWALCTNLEKVFIAPDTTINGSNIFKLASENFVLYGYKKTNAEEYAAEFGYDFKAMGDVNDDTSIDLNDASSILDFYAKRCAGIDVSSENGMDTDTADLNRNGAIGIDDATAALSYYAAEAAGLETDWASLIAE